MSHYPKPYWRSQRGTWCVQIAGKQITLAKGQESRAEAYREYHRLMATEGEGESTEPALVMESVLAFLDHAKATIKKASYDQYRIKLADFVKTHGTIRLDKITTKHVAEWVASHKWSQSTRRSAITAVKTWLGWCVRKGMIGVDPVKHMKRPRQTRRERTLSPAERTLARGEFTDGFGDFLDAMGWTGCRPGEIMRLEAAHIDWDRGYAALPGKTTEATALLIEFPLVPPMLALCHHLAAVHPIGPLFRNRDGNPWTISSVRCRMRRLRTRVKRLYPDADLSGVTAYTYRHSFATDALERGVPITDVAALMNHRDIRTTMNYNHLSSRYEHLKRQAEKASGTGESRDGG